MNALLHLPEPDESERHRRRLLCEADELLTQVEELRLARRHRLPEPLRVALRSLLVRAGQLDRVPARPSVHSAQEAIFAVQQRLMAANPRRPVVRAHPGRALGSPVVEPIRPGVSWKLLVLPAQPSAAEHDHAWRDLVSATVERALDRWFYAQHHAARAARGGKDALAAVMVARVAWNNYWELCEEAARVRSGNG